MTKIQDFKSLVYALLKAAIFTLLQISIFLLIYELIYELYISHNGNIRRDLSYGIQLNYGVYLLAILAFINGKIHISRCRKVVKFTILVFCLSMWVIYWNNIILLMPYRAFSVLFAGILSLCSTGLLWKTEGKINGFSTVNKGEI